METTETRDERLERLERFARTTKILSLLSFVAVLAAIVFGKYVLASAQDDKILRVRGIIIEDESGHARLLLGAPVPNLVNRQTVQVGTG